MTHPWKLARTWPGDRRERIPLGAAGRLRTVGRSIPGGVEGGCTLATVNHVGVKGAPMAQSMVTKPSGVARGPVTGTALKARKRAPFFVELYRTSVGKKYLMAVTGMIWMGYVLAHMIGNLKMYLGEEDLNSYAEFLKKLAYPLAPEKAVLWIFRIVLAAALILHVVIAVQLTRQNRKARPVKYQSPRDYQAANLASRYMRWTGVVILAFIVFHLFDLTWGQANPDYVYGEVYANVVASFSRVPVAIVYVVANLALGMHLYHGAWSIFQSLGWNNPRFNQWRRAFATGFAALIVVGNVSFPIAVQLDIVG
jgi:succinate dehydrogenase / fumarate reductase, cytochrome b subunit